MQLQSLQFRLLTSLIFLKFIDTEHFQRLRDLKLVDQVFHGAVHSRFEHSLGVYWLSGQATHLLEMYQVLVSRLPLASCCLLFSFFVGINHSSWVCLPFILCTCVGLVDWSLTSNIFGLFGWRRSVEMYASFNIVLLYVYQLLVDFPKTLKMLANFVGLYKISAESDWLEMCSGLSLIIFFFMLSSIRSNLEEMEYIISTRDIDLTEHLFPSRQIFHSSIKIRIEKYQCFC